MGVALCMVYSTVLQKIYTKNAISCLAKYLTRHSTHEKEILKDLSMAFETQKPMD